MKNTTHPSNVVKVLIALAVTSACALPFIFENKRATAQVPPPPPLVILPVPLNTVPIPLPATLDLYIKDRAAAIKHGKALFWDMQIGSDGITACASCHYQALGQWPCCQRTADDDKSLPVHEVHRCQ